MRVAAIQHCPEFKAKDKNLQQLACLVLQAAKAGARVIVLPELCTTGYSFMSKAEAEPYAEVVHARQGSIHIMLELAKLLNVHIAWGLVERDPGTGDLHNSQALAAPDGTLVAYAKINQWGNDFLWSKPGRGNPPILRVSFGKNPVQPPSLLDKFVVSRLGLLICRDVRDKARGITDFYEKGDADVVLMSANWGRGGFPAVAWMDFARDNGVPLVVSNRYGLESHNDFGMGGSCIVYPDGRVCIDGLVMGQDCIVMGDVP